MPNYENLCAELPHYYCEKHFNNRRGLDYYHNCYHHLYQGLMASFSIVLDIFSLHS